MIRLLSIVLALITVISCRQSIPLSDDEKTVIEENIRHTLNDYFDDVRKAGLTAELKYFDNSPEFFWVPPGHSGPIFYDSIAQLLKNDAPLYSSVNSSFDTLRIFPLSRELASYTGQLSVTMTDTTGQVFNIKLVETGIVVKRRSGWKLLNGQTAQLDK